MEQSGASPDDLRRSHMGSKVTQILSLSLKTDRQPVKAAASGGRSLSVRRSLLRVELALGHGRTEQGWKRTPEEPRADFSCGPAGWLKVHADDCSMQGSLAASRL